MEVEDFEYEEGEWARLYRMDIVMSIATFSDGAFNIKGGNACHVNRWIKLHMRSKNA